MSPHQIPSAPAAPPPDTGGLEPPVVAVLDAVPEFGPTYLALVAEFDDDPGGAVVFTELADFVAVRLDALEGELPVLLRALSAVEAVAGLGGPATDLVVFAFLDSLSPDERRALGPWLGRTTRSLLDGLEIGG